MAFSDQDCSEEPESFVAVLEMCLTKYSTLLSQQDFKVFRQIYPIVKKWLIFDATTSRSSPSATAKFTLMRKSRNDRLIA